MQVGRSRIFCQTFFGSRISKYLGACWVICNLDQDKIWQIFISARLLWFENFQKVSMCIFIYAFWIRDTSWQMENLCQTLFFFFLDQNFQSSVHVLIYATLIRDAIWQISISARHLWIKISKSFNACFNYADLIRDWSWRIENLCQTSLDQNFQYFNACNDIGNFDWKEVWQISISAIKLWIEKFQKSQCMFREIWMHVLDVSAEVTQIPNLWKAA